LEVTVNCVRGWRRTNDRGAEAVEFAIIVIPLFIIIAALVKFASIYNAQITLTQAAREGARLAGICNQNASCLSGVVGRTQTAAPGLTLSAGQIAVTPCAPQPAPPSPPTDAVVVITYQVSIGAPLISQTVTIHGKAHMPCGG